jgi:hypothetical protein
LGVFRSLNFPHERWNTSSGQLLRSHECSCAFNTGHLFDKNTSTSPKMTFVKQNMQKRMFESIRTKQKNEESNTFENWGKLELEPACREELFYGEKLTNFRRKARNGEKILRCKLSIYRGGGGGG